MLPQTLGSALSDPDDWPQIESGNQVMHGAPDEKEEPGNLHIQNHTFYPALLSYSLTVSLLSFLFERSLLKNTRLCMYNYADGTMRFDPRANLTNESATCSLNNRAER